MVLSEQVFEKQHSRWNLFTHCSWTDRFSEDLDFALRTPDPDFERSQYLEKVIETMNVYGYKIEVSGEDKADSNVKTRFLKDDSIKNSATRT